MSSPQQCAGCALPYLEEDPFYRGDECWKCRCKTQQRGNVATMSKATRRDRRRGRKLAP